MNDGTLLYIPNYVFENGDFKNKFFLILKDIDGCQLIVSLPSSIEYFPTGINKSWLHRFKTSSTNDLLL